MELPFQYNIIGQNLSVQVVRKMSEAAGIFDFMELGQVIMEPVRNSGLPERN